ncbi:MAG: hypothetical protein NUW01_06015 [Gemmatimonadaceae bacterium]|nr:hypothetical protein [Gemmatimonadaceae bacterium]
MATMLKCKRCEEFSPGTADLCVHCGAALFGAQRVERLGDPDVVEPPSGSPIVRRYRDAYRVGAALVALGNTIKIVGAVLGGVIVLGSLGAGDGPFGGGAVVAGLISAAIGGGLLWVCGVIVAAQGEVLRATLDTAVASSPFLENVERLDAMGLPRSIGDRTAAP